MTASKRFVVEMAGFLAWGVVAARHIYTGEAFYAATAAAAATTMAHSIVRTLAEMRGIA